MTNNLILEYFSLLSILLYFTMLYCTILFHVICHVMSCHVIILWYGMVLDMGHSMSTQPTSQIELIFGIFTDYNIIKLYMDFYRRVYNMSEKRSANKEWKSPF